MLVPALVATFLAASPSDDCPALHVAVWNDDLRQLEALGGDRMLGWLPSTFDLEERGRREGVCFGRTPLMLAAELGRTDCVKLLLALGAKVTATSELPLFGGADADARCLAIAAGHEELGALLDEAGAEPLACREGAVLLGAIHTGDVDAVRAGLTRRPSRELMLQALVAVAGQSRGDLLELLLEARIPFDAAAAWDAAIRADDAVMADRLWRASARLQSGEQLAQAISLGRTALFPALVAASTQTSGLTVADALSTAMTSRRGSVVVALLSAGWRPAENIPLLVWAMRETPELVDTLIDLGLDVEADDPSGTTPLLQATRAHRADWMKHLLARGASPLTADVFCRTPAGVANLKDRYSVPEIQPAKGEPVPGRTSRRLHVTCGAARVRLDVVRAPVRAREPWAPPRQWPPPG